MLLTHKKKKDIEDFFPHDTRLKKRACPRKVGHMGHLALKLEHLIQAISKREAQTMYNLL